MEQPEVSLPTLSPELIPVCACESVGDPTKEPSHFDAQGNVLRGRVNPSDIGMCQLNLVHEPEAKRLGLDLFDEGDNIRFANHLYAAQGLKPWRYSQACWNGHV